MSTTDAPQEQKTTGNLADALAHGAALLEKSPKHAAEQAKAIIASIPGQRDARVLLAAAMRRQGDAKGALDYLQQMIAEDAGWAGAHYEMGLALGALGEGKGAIRSLERALSLDPNLATAWRALGDQLTLAGDEGGADSAYMRHIKTASKDPRLLEAADALARNDIPVAERLLKAYLKQHPTDVAAIRMLAELAARIGRYQDAEHLLQRCIELAPSFTAARHNLAIIELRLGKSEEAYSEAETLLRNDPKNPNYRTLYSSALVRVGEYEKAIESYGSLLKEYPKQPKAWMSYGHALKTVGRTPDSIDAYKRSIDLQPSLGEAYWSLANLKTFRFEPHDITAMETQLQRTDIEDDDRLHLHFALGKALEDAKEYEASFRHYEQGNAIRQKQIVYDEDEMAVRLDRLKKVLTPALFAAKAGKGCKKPDPIFIVGMPRAGSTLLEQILSSHSQVEGTMELPDIIAIAKRLGGKAKRSEESRYPEILSELSDVQLKALGEEYLERTRIQRKTGKPFFIDKMPNNFMHVGLIHLILPNAKIIDARRHPMACCFSGFKQHFAKGQGFSYGLERIGRYYRDYVLSMKHFDETAPGVVHRVIYEEMVADPETQIRKLLDYCGLPFEEACLSFHETERAVRTASSEQVRQPIYKSGVDQWVNYEPWLGELKAALGDVLTTYPAAP
ncbi:tetratricopeptide repeat-containing sulfotransferase family protein [Marinicaulis aureus]|uniref:Tetratricopeptide repeat-containing sulfotransferase family protein n=1 Tax=Hyphococcus aureus TaxID=2666033 RepID=A0ABW1KY90_9PROT